MGHLDSIVDAGRESEPFPPLRDKENQGWGEPTSVEGLGWNLAQMGVNANRGRPKNASQL